MNFNSMNENYLAKICLASVCTLLAIWVLPNTIVIRHVLLGIGFISGTCLIQKNWASFNKFKTTLIPLYAILALFFWVAIHYVFFSLNPTLELSEIRGLWMRTLAGTITAIGLGIALSKNPNLRKYFYISLFFVPMINLGAFIYMCLLQGVMLPFGSSVSFVYAKIETAYFGAMAAAMAVANIIFLIVLNKQRPSYGIVSLYFLGIVLVLTSALVSSTKNGMAITLGLCGFLFLIILINVIFKSGGFRLFGLGLAVCILAVATSMWQVQVSFGGQGWNTVFQDAKTGLDIDSNEQWQKMEGSVPFPLNSLGIPSVSNTYTRFAYAAVGARLISQYPLGYGSINQSFNGLQTLAQVPHEHQGQVHSGWIDFGLAFGVPGLLLLLSSMIAIIYLGVRGRGELGVIAAMVSLTLIGFCLIAEMSYKQYFESWIFMMTFCATVVILSAESKTQLSAVR